MTLQMILEFFVALVTLVILHEVGHFLACKLFRVEVEEFGIGLPSPNPIVLFQAGGTKFTFNWLLLGGFVRPKGENDPSVPGGLAAASPWKRIAVFLAGPITNLLVGVLLYAIIYTRYGLPIAVPDKVQIVEVVASSPALNAGLQACDIIDSVNGRKIDSFDTLSNIIDSTLGQPVQLAYLRDGQMTEVTLVPRTNPPEGQGAMGVIISNQLGFEPMPWYDVISNSFQGVYLYARELVTLPMRLIRHEIPASQGRLVGFKGMYDIYSTVRQGNAGFCRTPSLLNVLGFFSAITISLGLLNLLPIPALDGGQILFALPEILFRRRIPQRYANIINAIFLLLLILLILYVNIQDFIRPVTP
jgi:regulator of sigma E protease